jgi:acyl-coenzyme A thioesterase PaaI-like protein
MTVNYTGFAVKSDLIAHARVKRRGKRIASLSVEVVDASDALIADALVTYKIA